MRSTIPLRHRLRHLLVYSGRVLPYNVGLSALGTLALAVLSRAELIDGPATARALATVAGLIVATGGHWLAIVVFGFAHRREYELFRAGGWEPSALWFASWAIAAAVAAIVLAAGSGVL